MRLRWFWRTRRDVYPRPAAFWGTKDQPNPKSATGRLNDRQIKGARWLLVGKSAQVTVGAWKKKFRTATETARQDLLLLCEEGLLERKVEGRNTWLRHKPDLRNESSFRCFQEQQGESYPYEEARQNDNGLAFPGRKSGITYEMCEKRQFLIALHNAA